MRKIVNLRWRRRMSPQAIASGLSMPASTVHAVLGRCRLNRLSHIDIHTGQGQRMLLHRQIFRVRADSAVHGRLYEAMSALHCGKGLGHRAADQLSGTDLLRFKL